MKIEKIFEGRKYIYVILEILEGGELLKWVLDNLGTTKEFDALTVIYSIIKSLIFLESEGIVHRDLKPTNIMMRKKDDIANLVLIDFGLSIKLSDLPLYKEKGLPYCVGSPGYIPPEMLARKPFDYKADIFSTGCMLYILVVGLPIFFGQNEQEILRLNRKCEIDLDNDENLQAAHLSKDAYN